MRFRRSLCTVVPILYGYCGPSHGQGSSGGIPDSCLDQWFTSSSTFSHVPGCPQCSDGHRRRCRRWPSEHEERVVWGPTTRFPCGVLRRRHSPPPTECRHCKKPHGERVAGAQTTSSGENERSVWVMDTYHLELAKSRVVITYIQLHYSSILYCAT